MGDWNLTPTQWLQVAQLAGIVITMLLTAYIAFRLGRAAGGGDGDYRPHPIIAFLYKEPVMLAQFVGASAALLGGFGLNMSGEQIGLTIAFLTVVIGLFMRQVVTSPATVEASNLRYDPDSGKLKRKPPSSK